MLDGVAINIKRSNRKTASIYIERDGTVSLYAPESLTDAGINEILTKNEYQIHKYLAKRELLNANKVEREPVNGQSYLYLGRNYYLQFMDELKDLELKGRYFYAPTHEKENLHQLFKNFYREKGKSFITPRAQIYAEKMDLQIAEIAVLELKNRWASCSSRKSRLNFHWKVLMAPVSVIEYLIVHELAHLKFTNHDSSFWNEIDKVIPNYQEKVEWLRRFGSTLTLE